MNILPNRFLGVVGEHGGEFPVENLALSRDKKLLASCSHDQKVKFWNVETVKKEKINIRKKAKKSNKSRYLKSSQQGDFFSGLEDSANNDKDSGIKSDDDDDDDSDDNDE